MSGWTPAELDRIDQAEELDLTSQRRDGSLRDPVTIWVVRDGEDLYVRSMYDVPEPGSAAPKLVNRAASAAEPWRRTSALSWTPIRRSTAGSTPHIAASIDATGTASSAVSSTQRHETQRSSSCRANRLSGHRHHRGPQPGCDGRASTGRSAQVPDQRHAIAAARPAA